MITFTIIAHIALLAAYSVYGVVLWRAGYRGGAAACSGVAALNAFFLGLPLMVAGH